MENALHSQVCSGRLDRASSQHPIATDWEAAYRTYVGPTGMTGPEPRPAGSAATPDERSSDLERLTAAAATVGLVFHRVEASMAREYRLWVQPALFGGEDVVRAWGRHGSLQRPRQLVSHHPDVKACAGVLRTCIERRLRRGYLPASHCFCDVSHVLDGESRASQPRTAARIWACGKPLETSGEPPTLPPQSRPQAPDAG